MSFAERSRYRTPDELKAGLDKAGALLMADPHVRDRGGYGVEVYAPVEAAEKGYSASIFLGMYMADLEPGCEERQAQALLRRWREQVAWESDENLELVRKMQTQALLRGYVRCLAYAAAFCAGLCVAFQTPPTPSWAVCAFALSTIFYSAWAAFRCISGSMRMRRAMFASDEDGISEAVERVGCEQRFAIGKLVDAIVPVDRRDCRR